MNWIDLVLAAIVVISALHGIVQGFSRVAISFAGTVIGLVVAGSYYPVAANWLMSFLNSEKLAKFAGFLLIFIGIQIVAGLLAYVVRRFVKATGLSWLDRILGSAFGFLRGLMIATILLVVAMAFPFRPVADVVAKSRMAPFILGLANAAAELAPKEVKDGFFTTYERVRQMWEESNPKPLEKSSS